MVDELRRAAVALLDDPPRPPGGLEDLAHRNARRHRRRRALSGAVAAVLALAGLTVVADGKDGDDARVVTVPSRPDGGVAVFPSPSGALLVPLEGGSPRTVDLGGAPGRLEWSSDGSWLAGVVAGRFVVVSRDGSDRRTLDLDGVTDFHWSPAAPILAVHAADGLYTATPHGRPHRIGDGGADLLWSADGRRLAFQDRDLAAGGIITMDADGTHRRLVGRYADLPGAGAGLQLRAWARDGRVLLYRVHDQSLGEVPDAGQSLVALDVEDGTTFELGPVEGRFQWVQVSPDGRSVAFPAGASPSYGEDKVLRSCDLVARRCVDLTSPDQAAIDPRWSPDGSQLVYVSVPVGTPLGETRLRVVSADGHDDHEVRGAGVGAREPRWMTDGTAIVYQRTVGLADDPPTVILERIGVDGGEPHRVGPIQIDPSAVLVAPQRTEAIWSWSPGAAASDP